MSPHSLRFLEMHTQKRETNDMHLNVITKYLFSSGLHTLTTAFSCIMYVASLWEFTVYIIYIWCKFNVARWNVITQSIISNSCMCNRCSPQCTHIICVCHLSMSNLYDFLIICFLCGKRHHYSLPLIYIWALNLAACNYLHLQPALFNTLYAS